MPSRTATFAAALTALSLVGPVASAAGHINCLHPYARWEQGQGKQVLAACRDWAAQSDGHARASLAEACFQIRNGNPAQFVHRETQAANQGDVLSMLQLGLFYSGEQPGGASPDFQAAYVWLSLAIGTYDKLQQNVCAQDERNLAEIPAVARATRRRIVQSMMPHQIAKARLQVLRWFANHPQS